MSRFEIQEMVAQSEQGVTYHAYDKQSKQDVALRRFFPFGPSGGGLEGDAAKDYNGKCRIFTNIIHPALRAVIDGGVDRSDTTPYLVTEWIEGQALTDVLGDAKLDPARAMDVARNALEVSLELSKVFGKQGVWVDTDPNSIVVGSPDSGRGFTFWVGLSRWFGLRPKQREVRSVATLVERLIGWDSKVYTNDSAGGFGGWVKTLKKSPFMSVEQALEQLLVIGKQGGADSAPAKLDSPAQGSSQPAAGVAPTQAAKAGGPALQLQSTHQALSSNPSQQGQLQPTHQALSSNPTQQGQRQPTHSPSKPAAWRKPLLAMAACLAVAGTVAVLVQKNREGVRRQLAENEAVTKANEQANAAMEAEMLPIGSNAVIGGVPAGNGAGIAPRQNASDVPAPPIFSPDQASAIGKLAQDTPAQLSGTLRAVKPMGESGNIGLYFSDPYQKGQIRALAGKQEFEGTPDIKMLESYIGKDIIVEGAYRYWAPGEAHFVRFGSLEQISINDSERQPAELKQERLAITPLDYEVIAELPTKRLVRLRGVVKTAMIPAKASCLKITFAESAESQLIHVIGCPSNFDGKIYSKEDFGHMVDDLQFLVGKTVLIDGEISRFDGTTEPHFIRIVRKDQIKVFK